jgi:4-hydroxy-3-polyprenylbenzoate decarboxylase
MYIICITGASGAVIGVRLVEELLNSGKRVSSVVSAPAWDIIAREIDGGADCAFSMKRLLQARGISRSTEQLREYANDDLSAPFSSGSSRFEAVIVAPCSMKSLAGIAAGLADSLTGRAADVALKEGRRCILIPRETPLSLIHIDNMRRAKSAGADILIPVPGFYTRPASIDDVVNFIVGKTLSLLGIRHTLFRPWGGEE